MGIGDSDAVLGGGQEEDKGEAGEPTSESIF